MSEAYNFAGVGYQHGIEGRVDFQKLRVRRTSNLRLEDDVVTPPLQPSAQELAFGDLDKVLLWVGMMPKTAGQHRAKPRTSNESSSKTPSATAASPPSTGRKKGQSITGTSNPTVLSFDPGALRVVVPLKPDLLNYYVLVNPEEGLCDTRGIEAQDVFFFKEYRDDAIGAIDKRRTAWRALIKQHIRDVLEKPHTEGLKFASKYHSARIEVPFQQSSLNELQTLTAAYTIAPERWMLDRMLEILHKVDKDLECRPSVKYIAIHKLFAIKKDFSDEDAVQVVTESEAMWPALQHLNMQQSEILNLANALRQTNMIVPYNLVRAFIVDWVRRLRDQNHDDEDEEDDQSDLGRVASATLEFVSLQWEDSRPSAVSIQPDPLKCLLQGIAEHVGALAQFCKSHASALRDLQGDQAVATSLQSVWETFAQVPDIDSAMLWANEAHRYDVSQLIGRDGLVVEKLEELSDTINKIVEGIRE